MRQSLPFHKRKVPLPCVVQPVASDREILAAVQYHAARGDLTNEAVVDEKTFVDANKAMRKQKRLQIPEGGTDKYGSPVIGKKQLLVLARGLGI